jgi:hypothetical protein
MSHVFHLSIVKLARFVEENSALGAQRRIYIQGRPIVASYYSIRCDVYI